VDYIANIGEMRNIYKILNGKPGRKRPVVGVDRRIILKWNLKKYDGGCSVDISDS
jgi:hypothetical protein